MKYILLLIPFLGFGQGDWEKVEPKEFMEVLRGFEQSISSDASYSFETHYRIYNDSKDAVPVKQFIGYLTCKSGNALNVSQMGQLMVQHAGLNLTIDTASRQLIVQKADSTLFYRKTVEDYGKLTEVAASVFRRKQGEEYLYILELKKGNPYKSMEFTITAEKSIREIVINSNSPYLVEDMDYSSAQAKIVMEIRNFRKGKGVETKGFLTVDKFVKQEGNQLVLKEEYKGYELIDLRN